MRRVVLLVAVFGALASAAPALGATVTTHLTVSGPYGYYTPQNQTIQQGDSVSWVWDSGTMHSVTSGTCSPTCVYDGKFDSGIQATPYTYPASPMPFNTPGVYHFYCRFHGAGMTGTITVLGPDTPPTARFTVNPTTAAINQPVTFDASSSSDTDVDTIASYTWNFGDGTMPVTTTSATTTHPFASSGTRNVTLTVRDSRNTDSTAVMHPVTITSAVFSPPKITAAKVKPKTFCAKKKPTCKHPGAKLRFTLSEAASVTVVVTKNGSTTVLRRRTLSASAGKNSLAFGKGLKAGKYVATLTASSGGATSNPVMVRFRVKKS